MTYLESMVIAYEKITDELMEENSDLKWQIEKLQAEIKHLKMLEKLREDVME